MIGKPPKIVIPGMNRGAGIPDGVVLGRRRGVKQGPVELLDLKHLTALGLATTAENTKAQSGTASTAQSSTDSLSKSISTSLSQISSSLSNTNSQVTSLSTAVSSVDSGQNVSLSQISSSLSGAISSTSSLSTAVSTVDSNQSTSISVNLSKINSLSTAVSTVISGSISTVNSRIDSLSTAGGGGGATTFLALTDTPASYVGQAAKVVRVNAGETALEFAAGTVDPGQSTSLSQISSSLSGAISSTSSLSTAVSTVDSNQSTSLSNISTSLSIDLSKINSLSTAVGGTAYEAGPITAPIVANFSWLNQGTSTASDGTGALIMQPQVDGQLHSLIAAQPGTPYDVYCRVDVETLSSSSSTTTVLAGIVFSNSANGDVVTWCVGCDKSSTAIPAPYVALQRWTSSGATFSSTVDANRRSMFIRPWKWLRANQDGTTITVYVSFDGKNWIQASSDPIASFIAAVTDYGFCSYGSTNSTQTVAAFSYFSTTAPA